jgi:membrane protein
LPEVPGTMRIVRDTGSLLLAAAKKFFHDELLTAAAALSYTTVFSLPPLLAIVLLLVGKVADPETVQTAIIDQVRGLIGEAGAEQVGSIISAVQRTSVDVSLATTLSVIALILGATAAFAQLQAALNQAWEVKATPKGNQIMHFVRKRLLSFGVVVTLAFLLLVSLMLSTALSAAGGALGTHLPSGLSKRVLEVINFVVSLAVLSGVFALMFKYLPDARIAWRDVRAGAIATALLFVGGKTLIGFYLGRSDPGTAYGAAGSLVVILLWVYYSSIIVLFGAELTRAWADRYGGGVKPEAGAVGVVKEDRTVAKPPARA